MNKQQGYHVEVCQCGRLVPVSNTIRVDTRKGFHIKSKPNTLKSILRAAWWYFRKEKSE